jgi:putative oxidoreductase
MALLLISAFWLLRGSFIAIAAFALATAVVSRLFSILRLNPPASIEGFSPQDLDLQVATGPGVPGFELLGWFLGALVLVQFILRAASVAASADSREASLNVSALTFIRVYLGPTCAPIGKSARACDFARRFMRSSIPISQVVRLPFDAALRFSGPRPERHEA